MRRLVPHPTSMASIAEMIAEAPLPILTGTSVLCGGIAVADDKSMSSGWVWTPYRSPAGASTVSRQKLYSRLRHQLWRIKIDIRVSDLIHVVAKTNTFTCRHISAMYTQHPRPFPAWAADTSYLRDPQSQACHRIAIDHTMQNTPGAVS